MPHPDSDPVASDALIETSSGDAAHAKRSESARSVLQEMDGGLTVLVVVAVVVGIYLGKPFLLPIAAALLMSFLLRPMVGVLRGFGLPRAAGAFVLLIAGLVVLGGAVMLLTPTITQTLTDLPETIAIARERVEGLSDPMKKTGEVLDQIEKMGDLPADEGDTAFVREPVEVSLSSNDRLISMLGMTGSTTVTLLITVILAFFLAASSETILLRAAEAFPGMEKRKRAARTLRELESEISRYLLTLTGINLMVGLAMTAAAWALGVPQPWVMGLIAVSSLVIMPSLGQAVWPPLAFLVINTMEAYVIGPMIYGSRLRLNAVAILVSLMFFTWVWGIPGAILAVPMLVSIRVICGHVPRWRNIEKLLGPA